MTSAPDLTPRSQALSFHVAKPLTKTLLTRRERSRNLATDEERESRASSADGLASWPVVAQTFTPQGCFATHGDAVQVFSKPTRRSRIKAVVLQIPHKPRDEAVAPTHADVAPDPQGYTVAPLSHMDNTVNEKDTQDPTRLAFGGCGGAASTHRSLSC